MGLEHRKLGRRQELRSWLMLGLLSYIKVFGLYTRGNVTEVIYTGVSQDQLYSGENSMTTALTRNGNMKS